MRSRNYKYFFGVDLRRFFVFLIFIVILAWLKIFLATKIYLNSKIVNDLRQDAGILSAENDMLRQDIEALKFKTQVSDVIIKSSLESDVLIRPDN